MPLFNAKPCDGTSRMTYCEQRKVHLKAKILSLKRMRSTPQQHCLFGVQSETTSLRASQKEYTQNVVVPAEVSCL